MRKEGRDIDLKIEGGREGGLTDMMGERWREEESNNIS